MTGLGTQWGGPDPGLFSPQLHRECLTMSLSTLSLIAKTLQTNQDQPALAPRKAQPPSPSTRQPGPITAMSPLERTTATTGLNAALSSVPPVRRATCTVWVLLRDGTRRIPRGGRRESTDPGGFLLPLSVLEQPVGTLQHVLEDTGRQRTSVRRGMWAAR